MAGYTSMFDSISPFHACFHGFLEISMDFEGEFNPYAPWCWNMFTNICEQNVPNVVIPSIGAYGEHGFLELSHWDYPLPTWIAAEVSEAAVKTSLAESLQKMNLSASVDLPEIFGGEGLICNGDLALSMVVEWDLTILN